MRPKETKSDGSTSSSKCERSCCEVVSDDFALDTEVLIGEEVGRGKEGEPEGDGAIREVNPIEPFVRRD